MDLFKINQRLIVVNSLIFWLIVDKSHHFFFQGAKSKLSDDPFSFPIYEKGSEENFSLYIWKYIRPSLGPNTNKLSHYYLQLI